MRLLQLNGYTVDIDEQTSIGIDLQAYDIKEPGQRKITVTNSFTIPATSNNLAILQFAGNSQFTPVYNKNIYNVLVCNYYVQNQHLIKDAKTRVEQVAERITLFIYEKADIWDELKLLTWQDFAVEYLVWLQTEKGFNSFSNPYVGTFANFITPFIEATQHVILPFYLGNLYNLEPNGEGTGFLEDKTQIYLHYFNLFATEVKDWCYGGHICIFAKSIFEFIEYKYGVDFLTSGTAVTGNIWNDIYATKIYTPIRNLRPYYHANKGWYLIVDTYENGWAKGRFAPESFDLKDKNDKTLFDFVNSFFQHFNIIKDEITVNNQPVIRLARFDDIKDSEVINWSGKLKGIPKFKPFIANFKQKSYIKFSEIYPDGNSLVNAKEIICNNKNIDAIGDLFEIDAYIPSFIELDHGVAPDLSIKESFKTFQFFITSFTSLDYYNVKYKSGLAEHSASFRMQIPAIYSLDSEYNTIENAIAYPIFYQIEKWIKLNDILNFEFFKLYYIQELNGSFFVNKIAGFNPQMSNQPTKIDIFKVSDRVATIEYFEDFFTDGIEDPFVDGEGNQYNWSTGG